MEAFARTPSIGSEAFQVLMLLLRRSYGYHKKEAEMSMSFIAKGTGMQRRNAIRAVQRLVSKRILVHQESRLSINKNYEEWAVSKRTPSVQTDTPPVSKRTQKAVSKRTPNKERDKETPEKEIPLIATPEAIAEKPQDGVNQVFKVFYDTINPQIQFARKPWRDAAAALIKRYGLEEVLALTRIACSVQGKEFAPTITNPGQLSEKLAALQIFIQKSQQPQKGAIQSL